MVVADIAALMSDQFKSLIIIIAKRIVDQACLGVLVSPRGRWMENRPKEGEPPKPGLGVVVRGQHTVTAGARRSRRHQMGKPRLETNDK